MPILATREAIIFLAYAQRWDDQLVFDLISDWHKSGRTFLERAYGELVGILVDWLRLTSISPEDRAENEDIDLTSKSKNESRQESIIWGHGHSSVLPSGNFNILSALASILLNRKEQGRDHYFAILDDHFPRERDPNVWKALLSYLANAGGSTPQIVSTFLRKVFDQRLGCCSNGRL
jgi:hypothetical protein